MNKESNLTQIDPYDMLKSHKIGNLCLTVTTLILVVVSIFYETHFTPFIILLMSSRIGSTVHTLIKSPSKKEVIKLVLWLILFAKSLISYCQFLGGLS